MSGYLDHVLSIFREHDHPFILVDDLAMRWHGIETGSFNIEVLVSQQKILPIAECLVKTGQWEFSPRPYPRFIDTLDSGPPSKVLLELGICKPTRPQAHPRHCYAEGTWLRHVVSGIGPFSGTLFEFLHFRTEDQYHLSISSCLELEAPDLYAAVPVLLEKEYDRDPHHRFGPWTWEQAVAGSQFHADKKNPNIVLCSHAMARSLDIKIPIFVAPISAHVNALLQSARQTEDRRGIKDRDVLDPSKHYVETLHLDWDQTTKWFLSTKIKKGNKKLMEGLIKSFSREPEYALGEDPKIDGEKLPWAIKIRDEKGTVCDERCGYCKEKGEMKAAQI